MKESFFTLTEDCVFENQSLNKGDIVLLIPVSAEYHEVIEWFEEDDVDYSDLVSLYVYPREEFVKAAQEDDWIFSHVPKYCDFINYITLPDLFLELHITSEEIDFGDVEVADDNNK